MQIDTRTGCVTLPDGFVVGPDFTRAEFLSSPQGKDARSSDNAAVLFLHGRFTAGKVGGHPLLATALFFEELLVSLDMTINLYPPKLYPPKAADWSSYSLDTEAAIKSMHDTLLIEQLGNPTKTHRVPVASATPAQSSLEKSLEWKFRWGKVWSAHDIKGGGTSFCVQYGNRLEDSNKLYRKRVNS